MKTFFIRKELRLKNVISSCKSINFNCIRVGTRRILRMKIFQMKNDHSI